MDPVARNFIDKSRNLLTSDYLPKIERCLDQLSDKDIWYDGVVAPYAAGSAIVFTPAESLAALREFMSLRDSKGGPLAWRDPAEGGYGFVDSFSLDPPYGHDDNLGIDAGPLLVAIENARTGLVWRLFMEHDVAKRAVDRLRLEPRE